jgi:serine/threonine protein kinase
MPYAPPETFRPLKKFTCSSDMFSFGIILFRILMKDFPYAPT